MIINIKYIYVKNIRFHEEETKFDNVNSEILNIFNEMGDIFINDAFDNGIEII